MAHHELHGDVVLIGAAAAVHFHRGADAHGGHRQVRHDEVLWTARQVQQLTGLVRDGREELQHSDGVQVVPDLPTPH